MLDFRLMRVKPATGRRRDHDGRVGSNIDLQQFDFHYGGRKDWDGPTTAVFFKSTTKCHAVVTEDRRYLLLLVLFAVVSD